MQVHPPVDVLGDADEARPEVGAQVLLNAIDALVEEPQRPLPAPRPAASLDGQLVYLHARQETATLTPFPSVFPFTPGPHPPRLACIIPDISASLFSPSTTLSNGSELCV